jgi:membrane-bound metal-dependent hydrolase YbcI (DUF457 family)
LSISAANTVPAERTLSVPSPIAHSSLVLVVAAFTKCHRKLSKVINGQAFFFYAAAVVTLCVQDLDFLVRIIHNHPSLAHGGATHSLCTGVFIGMIFAIACRIRYGTSLPIGPTLTVGIGCAWAHTLLDAATWGRGVMFLWPFSTERYVSPIPLFFGGHHSQPLAWKLHLVTLSTELLFAGLLWWLTRRFWGIQAIKRSCHSPALRMPTLRSTHSGSEPHDRDSHPKPYINTR